ncbi:MAG: (2Fe-2S)-binding protein [Longimicrobiales bacterium]
MSDVEIRVDGRSVRVETGATVAAALLGDETFAFRTSISGQPRGPLCGMGTCFECRVTINGMPHRRACMTVVATGMEIVTRG